MNLRDIRGTGRAGRPIRNSERTKNLCIRSKKGRRAFKLTRIVSLTPRFGRGVTEKAIKWGRKFVLLLKIKLLSGAGSAPR